MDTVTAGRRSEIMARIRSADTGPEMVVRRLAHSMGYRYRLHVKALPGRPDLVFPARKKIILVNGCFLHGHTCGACRIPKSNTVYWLYKLNGNRRRDTNSKRRLRRMGWSVLTVWECQLKDKTRLWAKLYRFLSAERSP